MAEVETRGRRVSSEADRVGHGTAIILGLVAPRRFCELRLTRFRDF
jgi:hypothetical protein